MSKSKKEKKSNVAPLLAVGALALLLGAFAFSSGTIGLTASKKDEEDEKEAAQSDVKGTGAAKEFHILIDSSGVYRTAADGSAVKPVWMGRGTPPDYLLDQAVYEFRKGGYDRLVIRVTGDVRTGTYLAVKHKAAAAGIPVSEVAWPSREDRTVKVSPDETADIAKKWSN